MRRVGRLAVVLASASLAGCELVNGGSDACATAARDYSGTVVESFNTTVGAIRRLEPGPVEPARWPDLTPEHAAVLCYIDGTVAKGPPPGLDGEIRDPFDRVVVGVVDGKPELIAAGYRDGLPVRAP